MEYGVQRFFFFLCVSKDKTLIYTNLLDDLHSELSEIHTQPEIRNV